MLPFFHEYHVGHARFPGHMRIALVMAMVVPACALLLFHAETWWNHWLWGSCGIGFSLALLLYSVVAMHREPVGLSASARRLVDRSLAWFPYFFVVMQSLIASLIVMFLWFTFTSLAMRKVPVYLHVVLGALTLLIPVRRYIWSRNHSDAPPIYDALNELFRCVWHILISIFIARFIIAITLETQDLSQENAPWIIIVWTPALLYSLFTALLTADHLRRGRQGKPHRRRRPVEQPETIDTF